jgi:hypothetical protein
MADLYHLLDELEEDRNEIDTGLDNDNDNDNDGDDAVKQGRPSLAVTEATEPMMSEDWDSPVRTEVPAALQEAREKNLLADEEDDYEDDGAGVHHDLEETKHVENELYSRLQHQWLQERHCPELLTYDKVMVNDIKEQISERQDYIDQLEASNDSVHVLMATIAQLDLDRIKFVFSDWLSTRLSKIEAHPLHMRESIDQMSDAEIAYLKQYGALLENHLRATVLDHIPEAWQTLDDENMIEKPDYEAYHFWLVKEPMDIRDMEQQEKGTCLVARYKDMAEPFREGKVELQL